MAATVVQNSDSKIPLLGTKHVIDENDNDDDDATVKEESEIPVLSKVIAPRVRNIDILKYLIGTIAGKDKVAKIIKSLLDVLRKLTIVFQNFKLNNIKTITSIASQLSIFRYLMRFGTSPYKISFFIKRIINNKNVLINRSLFEDSLDIYSTIFDELSLLYKLTILKNKKIGQFVSRQETWATEIDSLNNLRTAYLKHKDFKNVTQNSQAKLINQLDIIRFTMDFLGNSTDFINIKSKKISSIISLIASICSTVSSITTFFRLWTLARDQLTINAS